MKLVNPTTLAEILLPDDLLWSDELNWVPLVGNESYALNGALIVEQAVKQAGRPMTMKYPDREMSWVTRETVEALRSWASVANKTYSLVFEYPSDTRSFDVVFRHSEAAVEAEPVKGFPGHDDTDYFLPTIRFIQV